MKIMLKVGELFAGVGGFRIGLEKTGKFKVIFSNQWEPGVKKQWASDVYVNKFGNDGHVNEDVNEIDIETIPDIDLLVGGFPCQDYSVASTSKNSKGLIGKKGVLWWSIHKILSNKENKPKYLLFENVDRILKSPSTQRGRDFAVILKSLDELGYAVEWRVINAADYGMPQRRKRIFMLCYHKSSNIYSRILNDKKNYLLDGVSSKSFPFKTYIDEKNFNLKGDLVGISNDFNIGVKKSPFENTGILINGDVLTFKTDVDYSGDYITLGDLIENNVSSYFFIDDLTKWKYLKGPKKEKRITQDGHEWWYSEGGMTFPDQLDKASRTIITGEGGKSASRFKHVIEIDSKYRRLTPVELERLNMFPDNHTKIDGISDTKRAFLMGNALVIGIVEKLGEELVKQI